jgi:hypothetical protein
MAEAKKTARRGLQSFAADRSRLSSGSIGDPSVIDAM